VRLWPRRGVVAVLAFVGAASLYAMPGEAAGAPPGTSDEWPRLWGPQGDGRSAASGALSRAGTLQAKELWRRPLGSGYSGVSVVKDRVYTATSDGTKDVVIAFDAATGRELWRTPLGDTYRGHDGSKDGPMSTPSVDGGRVYLVGPHGLLVALDAASGKIAWRHDLKAEYGAAVPGYGFATSPVLTGGLTIVQAGGEKQHHMLAFDAATGKLAWTAQHGAGAAYVTPVLATVHGVTQIVTVANDKVLGIKPSDGTLLWSHARPNENEPSRPPLVLPDGRVLVHSWQEAALLKVTAEGGAFKAAEVWRSPLLKASYSPTVFHDGYLYGLNGQYLVCLDPAAGEVKWRQKVYGGNLILVDGHLVLLAESAGDLRVVEASPAGYKEKLKALVFNPGASSITGPSWAGGRIFVRNVEELVALEIGG
jgi:outer membrane protein assembly factor BamB